MHWLAKSDCLYPSCDSRIQSCKCISIIVTVAILLLHKKQICSSSCAHEAKITLSIIITINS